MGAGSPVGAGECGMSMPTSGSTSTVAGVDDGTVFAEVPGTEMGLSWPTRPAEDAVPSRPVLAAIAPTAAVSVRPMALAAAIADLLRIMVISPSSLPGEFPGISGVGNGRTSVGTGLPGAGAQLVKV